jgi:hypothetical protein
MSDGGELDREQIAFGRELAQYFWEFFPDPVLIGLVTRLVELEEGSD